MAKKRAHVDAILTATAASDIFTQDVEDMPEVIPGAKKEEPKPTDTAPQKEDAPLDPDQQPDPEPPKPAATGQVTQIQIIMKNRGITERDKMLEDLTGFFNRPIHSSKELSFEEADQFIRANISENRT